MGDDFDDQTAMWGVPLDEPADAVAPPGPPPEVTPPRDDAADASFLLRGDEPPSDGVYRPRLRGFGDDA